MKNMTEQSHLIGLLLATISSIVSAQDTVTVTTSHARGATDISVVHQAKCEDGVYGIQIARDVGRISLLRDGVGRSAVDLTKTNFGTTFLQRPVYGSFGFTCWNPGGINVFFFGVEMQRKAVPKPVSYRASLGSNGTFTADYGLQTESLEVVNSHLIDTEATP